MSDLTATGCGCGTSNANNGCSSIIWIILLLSCCGGCGNGTSLFGGNSDNGCESIIWIILLLSCCGNGSSLGCGC